MRSVDWEEEDVGEEGLSAPQAETAKATRSTKTVRRWSP